MASAANSGGTGPGNPQAHGHQTGELGQQQPDHLEIDEIDELDHQLTPSVAVSQFSSTQSVSSSIYDHVVENGRTYHRFKEGKYLLPNDEREQKRLDFQHQLYTALLNGKLFLSPVGDRLRNVLDVGTGTGIWAIEVGIEHPNAHIIGIDLSPIQPT
ncbi:hypothetical protein O1611_g9552 [Lasiodiplodia mahajangana]|uniref:Uncharacterized protein n=1 Tax=Lasiodiplodia mahajangana TaxID=1108764 RepID=A0ACC2J854_9PEZI|nr:hypothetical protein O1611_g9552 [Lasiodiplodia mahajangana]